MADIVTIDRLLRKSHTMHYVSIPKSVIDELNLKVGDSVIIKVAKPQAPAKF